MGLKATILRLVGILRRRRKRKKASVKGRILEEKGKTFFLFKNFF